MKRIRINTIFEHGKDYQPFGSAFIRLLRPLSHPNVQDDLEVVFSTDYIQGGKMDLVIIDRLWRPDISMGFAEILINKIRKDGAKITYAIDDNFHKVLTGTNNQKYQESIPIVEYFIEHSDGMLVTTPALRDAYSYLNPNIVVLPHALDERLLIPKTVTQNLPRKTTVIGFMGTLTHDEDLQMVLPALKTICQSHPGEVEVQIVGGISNHETRGYFEKLPVRYVYPNEYEHVYPLFMLWFTGTIDWDIGIAPLQDTDFNQSKSDIKFLDYCAINTAGVYSPVGEYPKSVHHTVNGLLVENSVDAWVEALELLLVQEDLRRAISANARSYLLTERILSRRSQDWVGAIKQILNW